MAQQTAVEWLIEQLRSLSHNLEAHLGTGDIRVTQGMIDEFEEQAKQIEKEQLFEFFKAGQDSMEEGGKSFHQITDKYLTINRI